jgi:hypothetical protein
MMPFTAALMLAAAVQAAALPVPTRRDAGEIMRVVLAFETRVHRDAEVGPPPCVRQRVGLASLGDRRGAVEVTEAFERRPPPPPVRPENLVPIDPAAVINSAEIQLSPFHRWRRVPSRNPGYVEDGGLLPAELQTDVQAAERAALVAPLQPLHLTAIDPAWLDRPLRMCRRARTWPALEFGSPVIVGDHAFVRADFDCVLCGQGTMLALRRRGASWELIAAAVTWVS